MMKAMRQPIFIVGAPRSGTTWLLSMLEGHPQCRAVTPELLGIVPARPTKETGIFLRGLSSREIVSRFLQLPADHALVEKTPGHLLQVGRIKRVFPGARIILVRRNSKDVIWSMIQANAFWEGSPKTIAEAVRLYSSYSRAEAIYYGYDAVVDYETLWDKPVEVVARLLNELGLDAGPASSLVAQTGEGRSLPQALSGVFRKGAPGEGGIHFTAADQSFIDANLPPANQAGAPSVLLATNHLFGWTGSETLLLTLIEGLLENGCRVAVYARHWNQDWLDAHFDPRVRLTDDLETLRHLSFDVAHVQHNICLVDVRSAFPGLPVLFSSLGVLPFLEQPVPFDLNVSHYLAISEEVAANLVSQGIAEHQIDIVRNLVSGRRFSPASEIREKPERILVLSYKMDEAKRNLLRAAAARIGASIRFAGSKGDAIPQDRLAAVINEADIVVSLGRGVVEAMLCGRVPLVFDIHGGDGLVTPDNLHEIRACNFSGRCHRKDYTLDDLVSELGKYRQEYGARLREMALEQFGSERNMAFLLKTYSNMAAMPCPPALPDPVPKMLAFCSAMGHEDVELDKRRQEAEHLLQAEILRIKTTVSWRITSPLRVIWNTCMKLAGKLRQERGRTE